MGSNLSSSCEYFSLNMLLVLSAQREDINKLFGLFRENLRLQNLKIFNSFVAADPQTEGA